LRFAGARLARAEIDPAFPARRPSLGVGDGLGRTGREREHCVGRGPHGGKLKLLK